MAITAKDVMMQAAITLQDIGGVRWPAPELHGYLNDGLREIVTIKPNARTKTVTLDLVEGTLQTLPDEYTTLSRVIRNIASAATGGVAIRPIPDRKLMDAQIPGWQSSTVLPFAQAVVHVIHDIAEPRSFYVVPGNNGTGKIEAVVGAYPAPVPAPTSNPGSINSYTAEIDLPDTYKNALTDYVIYRAYAKDSSITTSAARAQAHFELFRGGVTALADAESGIALATSVKAGKQQ